MASLTFPTSQPAPERRWAAPKRIELIATMMESPTLFGRSPGAPVRMAEGLHNALSAVLTEERKPSTSARNPTRATLNPNSSLRGAKVMPRKRRSGSPEIDPVLIPALLWIISRRPIPRVRAPSAITEARRELPKSSLDPWVSADRIAESAFLCWTKAKASRAA